MVQHFYVPRRRFVKQAAAFIATSGFTTFREGWADPLHLSLANQQELETVKLNWIRDAQIVKDFSDPAILSQFNDEIYYLRAPLEWRPNDINSLLPSVIVPSGFVTDLASIPREFWTFLPRDGRYMPAAIIHDYLYWEQQISKSISDSILNLAMQDLNVGSVTTALIYGAVRLPFGEWAWKNNTDLKLAGEKRILTKLPRSQSIKWSEWKLNKANFES